MGSVVVVVAVDALGELEDAAVPEVAEAAVLKEAAVPEDAEAAEAEDEADRVANPSLSGDTFGRGAAGGSRLHVCRGGRHDTLL